MNAIIELAKINETKLLAISSVYECEAVGFKGGNFYNLTVAISTTLPAITLLNLTQNIEVSMGRKYSNTGVRNTHYSSRNIDIDILYYGNININTVRLIIPHPEVNKRLFVTKPLQDMIFLLPSACIENMETEGELLKNQEVVKLKTTSKRLKIALEGLELLK